MRERRAGSGRRSAIDRLPGREVGGDVVHRACRVSAVTAIISGSPPRQSAAGERLNSTDGTLRRAFALFRGQCCLLSEMPLDPITCICLNFPAPACEDCASAMVTVTTFSSTPGATTVTSYLCQKCGRTHGAPRRSSVPDILLRFPSTGWLTASESFCSSALRHTELVEEPI